MFSIHCSKCHDGFGMSYTSDRTGNVRYYKCSKCDSKHTAVWKGKTLTSCFGEPQNTKMEDWEWLESGIIVILEEMNLGNEK